MINIMNKVSGALIASTFAMCAGCDHMSPGVPPHLATTNAAAASFSALAPTAADLQNMHLNYETFSLSTDGTYISFVPLPPGGGEVVVGINRAGAYTVRLIDQKCAFDVQVSVSKGQPFVLTPAVPLHRFEVSNVDQLKAAMQRDAANNYSCNIVLARIY